MHAIEADPSGTEPTEGIVHRRSPFPVAETLDRLTERIRAAGATIFSLVDHSGEAAKVGLSLRDTKLLLFGNPQAGTPVMQAAPLAALDLPLKVLVWEDDDGAVWMTCLAGPWLADRHGVAGQLARPLAAAETIMDHVAAST